MYRLTIVAAPSHSQPEAGSSFDVENGEISIGRHEKNQIVLGSGNVSKKHCVLVVSDEKVKLQDQNSSNGTFVNGKLSSEKTIRPGDRIGIGEFVLELSKVKVRAQLSLVSGGGENLFKPSIPASPSLAIPTGLPPAPVQSVLTPTVEKIPERPLEKLAYYFEKSVVGYFHKLNEQVEFRILMGIIMAIAALSQLVLIVEPILEAHRGIVKQEIAKRATILAQVLGDQNGLAIAQGQLSQLDVGGVDRLEGVRTAVVIDGDRKVMAPAKMIGQSYGFTPEVFALRSLRDRKGHLIEKGFTRSLDNDVIISVQPIQKFDPALARNTTIAFAVVSIHAGSVKSYAIGMDMVYSNALLTIVIIYGIFFYLLYRVTFKPIESLEQRLERALRGEEIDIRSKVKFPELASLEELIDSCLKRLPASGSESSGQIQDYSASGLQLVTTSLAPSLLLDLEGKVLEMNEALEGVSGDRKDSVIGQIYYQAGRYEPFNQCVRDMLSRVSAQGLIVDECIFNDATYQVQAIPLGLGLPGACVLFSLVRKG